MFLLELVSRWLSVDGNAQWWWKHFLITFFKYCKFIIENNTLNSLAIYCMLYWKVKTNNYTLNTLEACLKMNNFHWFSSMNKLNQQFRMENYWNLLINAFLPDLYQLILLLFSLIACIVPMLFLQKRLLR